MRTAGLLLGSWTKRPTEKRGRCTRRPLALEPLENRVVLSTGDLAMLSATALAPNDVAAQYQVSDSSLHGQFTLTVYRSADQSFDAADLPVGSTTVTDTTDPNPLAVGPHEVDIHLNAALDIDPSHKFVLVVARPSSSDLESDPNNDVASFRTWIVGAVTHGYSPTGQTQTWVDALAGELGAPQSAGGVGYDVAIPYHWEPASALPLPGMSTLAAQGMTAQILQAIASLENTPGFKSNDVVDVHLIGHSRGGGVISQVARMLPTDATPLLGGFLKLTMLDPHPARNTPVPGSSNPDGYYSTSQGPLGQLGNSVYLAFQAVADDPAVNIPRSVDRTEVIFTHTPVSQLTDQSDVDYHFINYWGVVPVATQGDPNNVSYYDLTALWQANPSLPLDRSHAGPIQFYFTQVVPVLGTNQPIPIPTVPTPQTPTGGGPDPNPTLDSKDWFNYESQVLVAGGIDPTVTKSVLDQLGQIDQALNQDQSRKARDLIAQTSLYILRQRGTTVPPPLADELLGTLLLAQILVVPRV